MGKTSWALVGVAVGALAGVVVNYVFGPAPEASFDQRYQSRLDFALSEGKRAAAEHEAELRSQFIAARQRRPSTST